MKPTHYAAGIIAMLLTNTHALAETNIDRQTETAMPRQKNMYGIGVGFIPKTSGSKDMRTVVLPVINANYGDRFYVNGLQAGVWLVESSDKRIRLGLSADARFGWDADDSRRTKGMHDRDFSVDVGPVLRWQTDYGTVNAQWGFDVGNASNGQNVQLQFIRSLYRSEKFRLNGLVGIQWNDKKFNDYYFGVAADETRPGRPTYQAGAGVQYQIGINGIYSVKENHAIFFGVIANRLGNEQSDSPIVETKTQPMGFLGYSIGF
ncbi:MipA/OmpV family protein [Methylobacillus gramineus]|uniref:MipA/OmpV family protein n=1 Tax=Methylobacillus gramineus TaxID=755169 RepID=UPI001CFFDD9C|nr:MipA/OmpV family protein [Methylobacillus gramineus]MCB5185304.1 MipA/OmpV family protein [Methylobacillus gramineus]